MSEPMDTPPAPEADGAAADRGISPISGRLGGRRARLITVAALAAGCGVFLAATWDRGPDARPQQDAGDAPPRVSAPFEPARRDLGPLLQDELTDPDAPLLSDAETVPELMIEGGPGTPAGAASPAEQRRVLAESARRAPLMAFSSGTSEAASAPPFRADGPRPEREPTALDRLRTTGPIAIIAADRTIDRNLLLSAGSSLPCILQTALDSTTPGLVACVLPQDVYSDAGTVVLLERGTRVLGEYQGGLQRGRRRLFVLWTRAVTPSGVSIALASPAADALGRSGFDGDVDARFWDRFGGALLLSLVDDGAYVALGREADLRSTARAPSDAAAAALEGSVDIPASLRTSQGSEVSIFTAQDLDFRPVYRLRSRR